VPVPGRDIMVQGWYQGGVSMFDFTDSAHPVEIAFFDRGPIDASALVIGGYWSAYWYNGRIYGSEIARGIDIFRLLPSEYLSQNEIDAATLVRMDELNVQKQPKIVWPASFTVSRAYLDQLNRAHALPAERAAALKSAIDKADKGKPSKAALDQLDSLTSQLEKDAASASGVDAMRMKELAESIKAKTSKLRYCISSSQPARRAVTRHDVSRRTQSSQSSFADLALRPLRSLRETVRDKTSVVLAAVSG
jgi:hypothetical protein